MFKTNKLYSSQDLAFENAAIFLFEMIERKFQKFMIELDHQFETPRVKSTRKMLSLFAQYVAWGDYQGAVKLWNSFVAFALNNDSAYQVKVTGQKIDQVLTFSG